MSVLAETPAPVAPVTLQIQGISKRFGGVQALDDVAVDLRKEVSGLIGPNGSGKTTLFNCIAGILRPDSGSISWNGVEITKQPMPVRAAAGIVAVPQNPSIFDRYTVFENVRLAAELPHGVAREPGVSAVESIDQILDTVGLADVRDVRAGDISYGHQRLLNVGLALAVKPKALLLDEPGAGLNDIDKHRLAAVVNKLRDAGLSVVIIEHDVRFLFELSDRVVVLDAGHLIAQGTPDEIRADKEVIRVYLG